MACCEHAVSTIVIRYHKNGIHHRDALKLTNRDDLKFFFLGLLGAAHNALAFPPSLILGLSAILSTAGEINPLDVQSVVPGAKIVVLVRDPTRRFVSGYYQCVRSSPTPATCGPPLEELLSLLFGRGTGVGGTEGITASSVTLNSEVLVSYPKVDRILALGRYDEHVDAYLQAGFQPSDLLALLRFEDDPFASLVALEELLGVPHFDYQPHAAPVDGKSDRIALAADKLPDYPSYKPPSAGAIALLDAYYDPHTSALVKTIEAGMRHDLTADSVWPDWVRRGATAGASSTEAATGSIGKNGGGGSGRNVSIEPSFVQAEPLMPMPWLRKLPKRFEPTWPAVPPHNTREAYATLLTGDDPQYFRGALVVAASIRLHDTTRDLVLMTVKGLVPRAWYPIARRFGWTVHEIEELEEAWWDKCGRPDSGKDPNNQEVRWGRMSSKLKLWEETSYQRVMFLDADAFLVDDGSAMFDIPGDVVAEHGIIGKLAQAPTFNAGFLIVSPSQATYEALIARGKQGPPKLFGNSLDCTEQGLLNGYFVEHPELSVTMVRHHRSLGDELGTGWRLPLGMCSQIVQTNQ